MKLRNKRTGEIREIKQILIDGMFTANSLAELNEEWEDYKEPKEYWYIDSYEGTVIEKTEEFFEITDKERKEIGNYFETEEEAEKAVEKLKAFKRLVDLGFKFDDIRWVDTDLHIKTNISTPHPFTKEEADEFNECLHKVFGGNNENTRS